jgi:acyl-CoA hydrolase
MPSRLVPADLPHLLHPGARVYVAGTAGESALVAGALAAAPDAALGVQFIGVWLPGINGIDYAGLHPAARATAFFIGRPLRQSFAAGRIELLPIPYSAIYAYLRDVAAIDLALLQVSPPGPDNRFSLGVANDFSPAILRKARRLIAHVNPNMPYTRGAATIGRDDVAAIVEEEAPLIGGAADFDPAWTAIGDHIAGLLDDGDTIEAGIGGVQSVFASLCGFKRLRIHSGAISTPLLRLVDAGALAEDSDAITTGIAYGSADLYDFVRWDPRVRFAAVGETHDPATLRAIARFVAINSVIEVDLLGQANAEMVDGRQVSGTGGLVDFMRGARLSRDGVAIVALPATARRGTRSRIVGQLPQGTAVSVSRADAQIVVTEYGVADLRWRSLDARAEALIAIAAPRFRDDLAAAWDRRRAAM